MGGCDGILDLKALIINTSVRRIDIFDQLAYHLRPWISDNRPRDIDIHRRLRGYRKKATPDTVITTYHILRRQTHAQVVPTSPASMSGITRFAQFGVVQLTAQPRKNEVTVR